MTRSTGLVLLSGALLGLCATGTSFGLVVKYLVDIIALGHSLAKTFLFLLFVLTLSLFLKWLPELSSRWKYRFAGVLPFFFVANFVQYVWYCRHFGLKVNGWSAVVKNGYWSMSRLDHIHTAKAMLSGLPTWLAIKTDVGYSIGAVFWAPLLWLQLTVFLLTLVVCFLACVQRLQSDSAGRAVSYVLASFVLMKCLVDGGVLTPEVWAAAPVFAGIGFGRRGLAVVGPLTVTFLSSLIFWKAGALSLIVLDWLPALLALSLPLVFERRPRLAVVIGLLVLVSPVARYGLIESSRFRPHALNTAAYAWTSLEKGWKLHIVSFGKLKKRENLRISSESLNEKTGFCLTEATLLADTTVFELCQDLDLETVRRPVSWYPGLVRVTAKVQVLEGSLEEILDSPLINSWRYEGDALQLDLRSGVNKDLAVSLLGPRLSIVHDFVLSYP